MRRRTGLRQFLIAVGAALLAGSSCVWAATAGDYPSRPVRLVLPFPPGGGADAVARIIAPKLYEALGQQWVVDNRGGASGTIAAGIVAHAEPDGYTVFQGFSTTLTVAPLLYRLPFDVTRDLIPIVTLTAGQYMLVLHPTIKADNLKEFIAFAKAQPGSLDYASAGLGSPLNLAAELFKARTGIAMTHVPYKGGGPASLAVLGGEVQVMFGSLPSVFPHVKAGRLKALAVTGPKRAAVAPGLPTIAESGFPGFEVTTWYGLMVPAGTPERVRKILHDETAKAMQLPDVKEQIARQGLEVIVKGPGQFAAQIRNETAVWAKVIKAAGIKLE